LSWERASSLLTVPVVMFASNVGRLVRLPPATCHWWSCRSQCRRPSLQLFSSGVTP